MFNTFNNYKNLFIKGVVNSFEGQESSTGAEEDKQAISEPVKTEELIIQAKEGGIDEQELDAILKQFNKDVNEAKEELKEPMKKALKELLLDTIIPGVRDKTNGNEGIFEEGGDDSIEYNEEGFMNFINEEMISGSMSKLIISMGISKEDLLKNLNVGREEVKKSVGTVNKNTKFIQGETKEIDKNSITSVEVVKKDKTEEVKDLKTQIKEVEVTKEIKDENEEIQKKVNALLKLKIEGAEISRTTDGKKIKVKTSDDFFMTYTIPELLKISNGKKEYNEYGEENLGMLELEEFTTWVKEEVAIEKAVVGENPTEQENIEDSLEDINKEIQKKVEVLLKLKIEGVEIKQSSDKKKIVLNFSDKHYLLFTIPKVLGIEGGEEKYNEYGEENFERLEPEEFKKWVNEELKAFEESTIIGKEVKIPEIQIPEIKSEEEVVNPESEINKENKNIQQKVEALLKIKIDGATLSQTTDGKMQLKGPNGHYSFFTIPELLQITNGKEVYNDYGKENLKLLDKLEFESWINKKLTSWKEMDNKIVQEKEVIEKNEKETEKETEKEKEAEKKVESKINIEQDKKEKKKEVKDSFLDDYLKDYESNNDASDSDLEKARETMTQTIENIMGEGGADTEKLKDDAVKNIDKFLAVMKEYGIITMNKIKKYANIILNNIKKYGNITIEKIKEIVAKEKNKDKVVVEKKDTKKVSKKVDKQLDDLFNTDNF